MTANGGHLHWAVNTCCSVAYKSEAPDNDWAEKLKQTPKVSKSHQDEHAKEQITIYSTLRVKQEPQLNDQELGASRWLIDLDMGVNFQARDSTPKENEKLSSTRIYWNTKFKKWINRLINHHYISLQLKR